MEKQKWWGQDSGLADLREKIGAASCGEEYTGDCPGPRKETTAGLRVTHGGGGPGGEGSLPPAKMQHNRKELQKCTTLTHGGDVSSVLVRDSPPLPPPPSLPSGPT